jgi:two-component system chemotaxis response regulator CheY
METPAGSFEGITVLIVDDFEQMRLVLRRFLERMGFREILEAENGASAISLLGAKRVDLIISDWDMPDLNGMNLLKHLRLNDSTGSIPFLMITAKPNEKLVLEARRAKVDDFLVKPFTMASLREKVIRILWRQ